MKRFFLLIAIVAIFLTAGYSQNSARMCTVKRGGATLVSEIDSRTIKVKAGRRLGYIEAHANFYVLVSYSGSTWRVPARQVVCK